MPYLGQYHEIADDKGKGKEDEGKAYGIGNFGVPRYKAFDKTCQDKHGHRACHYLQAPLGSTTEGNQAGIGRPPAAAMMMADISSVPCRKTARKDS